MNNRELRSAARYCRCGTALQIEYKGSPVAVDAALVQMFDELHHGDACAPATPQRAAIARSTGATYVPENHLRPGGVGGAACGPPADPAPTGKQGTDMNDQMAFLNEYDMLFPDYDGDRGKLILALIFALELPRMGHYRSRDAWIEVGNDGNARIRLLCKLGGENRASHADSVATLRGNANYQTDFDEAFNPAFASFCFSLPETLPVEVRAEMASHARPQRDLTAEAKAAKEQFAWADR